MMHSMKATNYRVAAVLSALLLVVVSMTGCAATRGRRGAPEPAGFLGNYSQLKKNPDFPASLVYVDPSVQWSKYDSIQIDSAGLWVGDNMKLSAEDQQMLAQFLYNTLRDELGKYFVIREQPDVTTLRLRVALTQAKGAKVALRTVTTVIPQLRLAGSLVGLAADTASTVGSATVEMEALDPVTNRRVAAAVDQRAGTKVLFAKRAYQTWGDVQVACEYWSKRLAWRLAQFGVQLKPGATKPEEPTQSRSI